MAKKRRQPVVGTCHICGDYGELTFEHTPPEKAFNNLRVIALDWDSALQLGPDEQLPQEAVEAKAVGRHTLCARCNNNTGSWYCSWFIDWCYKGMIVLQQTGGRPQLVYAHRIRPLPILKQILSMMFSVNAPNTMARRDELVRFVLNRETKSLPSQYRFFAYYNIEGHPRTTPIMAVLNFDKGAVSVQSEI